MCFKIIIFLHTLYKNDKNFIKIYRRLGGYVENYHYFCKVHFRYFFRAGCDSLPAVIARDSPEGD